MDTFFRVFSLFSYLNSGNTFLDIYKCPILRFLSSGTKKQLIGHMLKRNENSVIKYMNPFFIRKYIYTLFVHI